MNPATASPRNRRFRARPFWQCLANGVKTRANKIKVIYETRGLDLVTNDAGEVIGVIADQKGKKVAFKARKAVVLCSGGYEYHKPMRQAFLEGPGVEGWAFYGTIYNEGDGIVMGQKVGAGIMKAGKAASRIIMPSPIRHNGMRLGMITPAVGFRTRHRRQQLRQALCGRAQGDEGSEPLLLLQGSGALQHRHA